MAELTIEEKLAKAMDLLMRAEDRLADDTAPDPTWWFDLFTLTGDHMVLTEEGWEPGECKESLIAEYGEDHILDEVNGDDAPK